jgi:uncharacterized BrkB/YihY/UPF0761 family membrane protein
MFSAFIAIIKFIASNFNEFLAKNGPYMSAAIAYYAFFSLFPLTLALIAVFSLFLGIEGFEEDLIAALQEQIPVLAETGDTDDSFLVNFFEGVKGGRTAGGVVAVIGLFWVSQQVFLTLYWWLPNTKLRFKEVWPTALAGAAAFEISKAIFVFYIRNMGGVTNNIYGGLSAIIVLMIFVYVSAIILLVGAMLTSRYAYYLAETEQKKRNRSLSRSLYRIRGTASLSGMPNPVPAGAQELGDDDEPEIRRNSGPVMRIQQDSSARE